jgi:uncharacterized protein with HEPN domain
MNEMVEKRLRDAQQACRAIYGFVRGLDFPGYSESEIVRSAVERKLEIIGEALNQASQMDSKIEVSVPELRQIVAIRNRVIHGYDSVDDRIIWDVVSTRIPILYSQLESLLDASS